MTPERTAEFAEARELQWTWKTPAMAAMAVAICELAQARNRQEFSANDLALANHGGVGIAGAVFHRLAKDAVIEPVLIWTGAEHQQKFVRNAGGNRVGVWRLKCSARARRLVELHGAPPPPKLFQAELLPGGAAPAAR